MVLIGPILNSYLKTCNFTEINRDCQTYAIRRDHAHPFFKTYSENLLSSKNHGALLKRVFLRKFRKLFLRIDIAKLESLETHLRLKVCRNIVYWWDVCVSIIIRSSQVSTVEVKTTQRTQLNVILQIKRGMGCGIHLKRRQKLPVIGSKSFFPFLLFYFQLTTILL